MSKPSQKVRKVKAYAVMHRNEICEAIHTEYDTAFCGLIFLSKRDATRVINIERTASIGWKVVPVTISIPITSKKK